MAVEEKSAGGFGLRYWLPRCEGFRVTGPDGYVGMVDEVLMEPETDSPGAFLVSRRAAGGRRHVIPLAAVDSIVPPSELLVLRAQTGAAAPPTGLSSETTQLALALAVWENEGGRDRPPGEPVTEI